jgi:hypothetical protein
MPNSDTRVWIAQAICPWRHCLCTVAFDEAHVSKEEGSRQVLTYLEAEITAGRLHLRCEICNSTTIKVELGRTRFASIAEAIPAIRANQQHQKETRQRVEHARRSSP